MFSSWRFLTSFIYLFIYSAMDAVYRVFCHHHHNRPNRNWAREEREPSHYCRWTYFRCIFECSNTHILSKQDFHRFAESRELFFVCSWVPFLHSMSLVAFVFRLFISHSHLTDYCMYLYCAYEIASLQHTYIHVHSIIFTYRDRWFAHCLCLCWK